MVKEMNVECESEAVHSVVWHNDVVWHSDHHNIKGITQRFKLKMGARARS
jgi:hypothetical protein